MRFRNFAVASSIVLFLTGCATPRAIRNLSKTQLAVQKSYAQSLQDYFTVIEAFAEAQVQVANSQIDRLGAEIDSTYKLGARQSMTSAISDADRQKILDQLVSNTKENHDSTVSQKTDLQTLALKLKAKDADMQKA